MSLLNTTYNAIVRPHLPRKIGTFNGVAVRWPRLLDRQDHYPEWKRGTVGAVREQVGCGDHVVDVGTGFGVCTTVAARQGATVDTFEASVGRVEIARETMVLNDVEESVDVHHAVVGAPGAEVFGSFAGADRLAPEDLPACDVLVTDCEGAERELVEQLDVIQPERLVIETHGFAGSPTEHIVDRVEAAGYSVVDVVAPASTHADPEEDNKVVVAHD